MPQTKLATLHEIYVKESFTVLGQSPNLPMECSVIFA